MTGEAGVTEESDSVDRKSVELIFAVQEVKDMSVKKATLLEFDGIDTCHMCDKDVVTAELLQHFLESKIKDSSGQVRAITPGLHPHTTFESDIVPIGIGSDGDEKARLPEVTYNRQDTLTNVFGSFVPTYGGV